MSDIEIRLAEPSEAAAIASLLLKAFAEYRSFYTPEGFAATTPNREQILSRFTEGRVWVAVIAGEPVGTASAVLKTDFLHIRGMAVLPEARGRRVGELLLAEGERYASMHNCNLLVLSTTPFLTRALRLYECFGFQRTDDGPHDLFGTALFTMKKPVSND